MNKMTITIAISLLLAGCVQEPIRTENGGAADRTVDLVAVAPDGTHLWRYDPGGGFENYVYFASRGSSRAVGCGKNCTRVETVSTAP